MEKEKIDLESFARQYGFGYLDTSLNNLKIEENIINMIDAETAQKYKILPYEKTHDDSSNEEVLELLTSNTEILRYQQDLLTSINNDNDKNNQFSKLFFFFVKEENLQDSIARFYNLTSTMDEYSEEQYNNELVVVKTKEEEEKEEDLDISEANEINNSNSPIVQLVNTIIRTAVREKASDIHFEPLESGMKVKFRIDGSLVPQKFPIPEKSKKAIISRIKIMSELDVSKRRTAQDGSIKLKIDDIEIDFRVSCLPVIYGEKAVLRILDKTTSLLKLETLGFKNEDIKIFNKLINKPNGLILITGPTGSGKTTTLYSFLGKVDTVSKNVTTIEDPVEYHLNGVNQVNVNQKHLSFEAALRSILRQDPNIIMVGEIRDEETAKEVVNAAQTGHLVFSTLHTNDSFSVLTRLKNLNIDGDDITQSLLCVIAQRLVRKICPDCQEEYNPNFAKLGTSDTDIAMLEAPTEVEKAKGIKKHVFIHGKGCETCNGTGYSGRITAYEYYLLTDEIRKKIEDGTSVYDIKAFLRENGTQTMWENGLELVKNNISTIEEITHEVSE